MTSTPTATGRLQHPDCARSTAAPRLRQVDCYSQLVIDHTATVAGNLCTFARNR